MDSKKRPERLISARNNPGRRRFLATAGTTLLLPWLDSLGFSRRANAKPAGASKPPLRFLAYYVANGINMREWTPAKLGPLKDLPKILSPLADNRFGVDLRHHVRVLSGLRNDPGIPYSTANHASGTSAFLTCTRVPMSESKLANTISVDQVYANKVASQTAIRSLQLGCDGGGNSGVCEPGYSCAYLRNISWAGPGRPMSKLTSPTVAFNLLFGGPDSGRTKADIERRKLLRLSVLDATLQQSKSLEDSLGRKDREKLHSYLDGIRQLEKRIQNMSVSQCDTSAFSPEYENFPEYVDVMTDLMVLAMQCDATRSISFMMANGFNFRQYDFLGIRENHHSLSHHGNDPAKLAKLTKIDHWEIQKFVRLLAKMQAVQEGEGTLLDNSVVYFSSELSDGHKHHHHDLPVLVAGHAGGAIGRGGHMRFADQPMANLFISLLGALGVQKEKFGDDGTGHLFGI